MNPLAQQADELRKAIKEERTKLLRCLRPDGRPTLRGAFHQGVLTKLESELERVEHLMRHADG